MELFAYSLLAFTFGSIPFSVILTNLYKGRDVRSVGDNNPGAANAWKIGGSIFGIIVTLIEFSKAIIPIYLAIHVGNITGNNRDSPFLEISIKISFPKTLLNSHK